MRGMVTVLNLLCVLPAMAAPPQGQPASEGLEIGLPGWRVSDGSGTCSVGIDPQVKCDGRPAAVLRREKAGAAPPGYLECGPLPVKPSQVYLLECSVKGRAIAPSGAVLLAVRFGCLAEPGAAHDLKKAGECYVGAGPSSGPGPGGRLPVGTFDWQPFRLYVRAFDAADVAVLRFTAPTAGTLWVSDVRFTAVPVVRNVKSELRDGIAIPGYGDAPEGYLTDGIFCWNQGANNEKIGRGYRGLEQGITISLSLPRPTMVDRLVLSLVRVNCGHTLQKIEVNCNKYGQRVKVAEGPGYLTEEFDQRLWIVEAPVRQRTDAIELKLFGGGYLVPYEILVVEGSQARDEDMQKYALAGWFVLAASAAPAAQEPVVVENEFVRMEFCPAEGGVCKRMLYKPAGKELVSDYSDAGYGLFRDCFWSPTERNYADVVYRQEVTKTVGSVAIHLWGRGAGGIYSFTEVHKTITLANGSPLIRAEYEIKNTVDSMTDGDYGLWVHNFLGVIGGKNQYFIPTTQGILEVCNDPNERPRNPELWIRNPARGWMAGVGEGRHGLAWAVDYRHLNLFYQFLGLAVPTCEWRYNRIPVPCGQSLKTEVTLMPFTGLERVDGFFGGVAGSIILPAQVAPGAKALPRVELVAAGKRELTLRFRSRLLPTTAWTLWGSQDVELGNAVAQSVAWPQEMLIPTGTTVIGCEIVESGQPIGSIERPLVAGAPSGVYALAPECAQVGSKEPPAAAEPGLPEHKLSLEVASPHVPWAKPYARGPLKALILTDCGRQREIVELMERFDLEVETEKLFYDTEGGYFNEVGERSARTPQQAQARLKKKLHEPLDVIMIAGLHWAKTFDDETRNLILDKAKAGTGLVYVAPLGVVGDLQHIWPFARGEKRSGFGFLEAKRKHFLTAGIPYDLLPRVGGIAYDGRVPDENVLLTHKGGGTAKEIPLVSAGEIGKGRWVCFAWDVYSNLLTGEGYSFSRITPQAENETDSRTRKPGVMTDRAGRKITWRCWEYFFSLAGRGLLWAARRDSDLAAEVAGRDASGGLAVTVECPDQPRSVVLEMTYRNKFSEDVASQRQAVDLVKGKNAFHFTPPANLMPGVTLADLRVLTPVGKVVTWASGYYQTKPTMEIAAVELERAILPPGAEPVVRGRVRLSGQPGPEHALEVAITDFHGRLVFRQALAATATAFEARPLDALSVPMTLEVRLRQGGRLLDRQTQTVLLLKPRTWDPLECCQYEWYCSAVHGWPIPYLYDLERQRAGLIGITSMMDNPLFAVLDAEVCGSTSPLCIWDMSDRKFHEKSNAYARTKDRKYLVREPCLWDPAYREQAQQSVRKAAEMAMAYGGGHAYCLGDEMTLTSYNAYYDFDFAPASIAAYRRWLQRRYGTVAALNGQWGTVYKEWAEILPMTAEEARRRGDGNYAPWADFRTFMDDSQADFFACLQKALEEVDPQAKVSISGTQDATAGNGVDWWKLCHSLRLLHSYSSENTQYLHQAFSRAAGTLVAPYLNNACGRACGPVREGNMWWAVFYECFGLTSLGTPNYFLPDLTISETGLEARNFLAEVRGGIWPLLRSVRRDPPPIAILHSQPSIQANCILNREQRCQKVRDAWVSLLHDSGLQFDFVACAQLASPGFLAKHGYRALVLPECLALSDKEAAEIRAFAQGGGVVIADNSPGWMNEHCRTLGAGQLDDLFGLSADRQPCGGGKPTLTLKEDWGGLNAGQPIAGFAPLGKVVPAKAAAALCSPDLALGAIYHAAAGEGQAVYLNLCLAPYLEERQMGGRGETVFRRLIAGGLALAGIRPEFAVEPAGKKAFHGHVVSFTDQEVRYLGIIREYVGGEPEDAFAIRLPAVVHVYDVRKKKHLGQTDKIAAVLYPGAAKVYCLSPIERPAPTLECPAEATRGSSVRCALGAAQASGAVSVMRLEMYDPAGTLRSYYSGPRLLKPGQTRIEAAFSLALNDPPGPWVLKAVELVSGKMADRKLVVK
ncbi:MAG: beta-galactosidase [Thermoguttaceae bacterium]|jgi:hypothetical protein